MPEPDEAHIGLYGALLAFQAEVPNLQKNAKAKIESSKGESSSYTYRYLTLDALMDAILPVLGKHSLVWTTAPCRFADEPKVFALGYELRHVDSGEKIQGMMPLALKATPSPREVGSAISYARRYAVQAVLGVVTDHDDDAAQASTSPYLGNEATARVIAAIDEAGEDPAKMLASVGATRRTLTKEGAERIRELLDANKAQGAAEAPA